MAETAEAVERHSCGNPGTRVPGGKTWGWIRKQFRKTVEIDRSSLGIMASV
jgi:hypothetical protein